MPDKKAEMVTISKSEGHNPMTCGCEGCQARFEDQCDREVTAGRTREFEVNLAESQWPYTD